jgi:UDP-N-acetylmuramyl tripeptide synthase
VPEVNAATVTRNRAACAAWQAFAEWLARAAGWASRRAGRGSGLVITGRVLTALAPRSVSRLAAGRRIVLVSGTNGKSTTARLLAAAWAEQGPVTANRDGANLMAGIASTLLQSSHERVVLEVDEVALPAVIELTKPELVVLLNLARDQLDRVGEVSSHVRGWQRVLRRTAVGTLVVNADDPLLVSAVEGAASEVAWVGAGLTWREDARGCRRCGQPITFEDHDWWCDSCGLRRPPVQAVRSGNTLCIDGGPSLGLDLDLPGDWNRANAAIAVVAARALGVDPAIALEHMRQVRDVNGRYAQGSIDGHEVRLLLAKNPASTGSILDLLLETQHPIVFVFNAGAADGRDPSWLWDVPFERLSGRRVVVTGRRAADLSVRLRYALVEHEVADDLPNALRVLGPGLCDVVANYTAFAATKQQLQRTGGGS